MRAVSQAVPALAENPEPPDAFVRGGYRRLRVGEYRVLYRAGGQGALAPDLTCPPNLARRATAPRPRSRLARSNPAHCCYSSQINMSHYQLTDAPGPRIRR